MNLQRTRDVPPPAFHWFRSGQNHCAAVWHAPAAGVTPAGCVVLCPSWGVEQLRGQRDFRVLSSRLAAAGIAALRFDYPHTVNSATEPTAVRGETVTNDWLDAIVHAVRHARELSGGAPVTMVGRRIGATLVSSCVKRIVDAGVEQVVYWEPCLSGAEFLRELRLRESARLGGIDYEDDRDRANDAVFQSDGFSLERSEHVALGSLRLEFPACAVPVHVIVSRFREALTRRVGANANLDSASNVQIELVADAAFDLQRWEGKLHSEVTLARIAQIVRTISPARSIYVSERSKPVARAMQTDIVLRGSAGSSLEERALRVGTDRELFGIMTRPQVVHPCGLAVLLLGSGTDHSAGQGDVNVKIARELASRGVPTLRMDFRGLGESPARAGQRENVSYSDQRTLDVLDMTAELKSQTNAQTLAVLGVCSGGFYAVHAAAKGSGIDHVISINPQLYWNEAEEFAWSYVRQLELAERASTAATDVEKWRRLLSGDVSLDVLKKAALGTYARLFYRHWPMNTPDRPPFRGLPRLDIRRLFNSKVRYDLVFSRNDDGYHYFAAHGNRALRMFESATNRRLHILDRADHTFSTVSMRERLDAFLLDLIAPR